MLDLAPEARAALWTAVVERIGALPAELRGRRATPALDAARVRDAVAAFDFERPLAADSAVAAVADALLEHHVLPPHPRYFGLFNPAATEAGAAADALVAAFNPNVAAWSHSPFATEAELRLAREFAALLGLPAAAEGVFVSGGAEANFSAVLAALTAAFPAARDGGLRALPAQPVVYVSAECHHSFDRAARMAGLGAAAVRRVAIDEALRMRPDALAEAIEADRRAGLAPFLVAATAGTTNAGAIDPLPACAQIARSAGLWFHVDAAWAGAAALAPERRALLDGVEAADSVTLDAHKWLSAPMGAGLLLCARPGALEAAFGEENPYMPREAGEGVVNLYQLGPQWSRRFVGLKLFLSLAIHGWEGYRGAIRRMFGMGDLLRARLQAEGWRILNRTPLPIVCFDDGLEGDDRGRAERLEAVRDAVFRSGAAWISTTRLGGSLPALRACVTNFRTGADDVEELVAALERNR